jgi:hypothetical protein
MASSALAVASAPEDEIDRSAPQDEIAWQAQMDTQIFAASVAQASPDTVEASPLPDHAPTEMEMPSTMTSQHHSDAELVSFGICLATCYGDV